MQKEYQTSFYVDYRWNEDYKPGVFIDLLKRRLECGSAYEISRKTTISYPVFSRIRHRQICISDDLLLFAHDITGMSIYAIKELVGIPQYKPKWKKEQE